MPRYRLLIEYDGTPFVGWQIQGKGRSIQGQIRNAIHAISGEWVEVRGAGRTDAGVHALGQVAHFNVETSRETYVWREAINAHLRPDPISILDVAEVPATFDARFSATARHYLYRLCNRRGQPALDKGRVWWVARPLDAAAMADAAGVLVGHHDFTTFRSAACQAKSPVKTLDQFSVDLVGCEIHVRASARSFMHNQVRSMVGSLKRVGDGKWSRQDLEAALQARDRARCGPVAPASGLYFVRVDYSAAAVTPAGLDAPEAE
jgi:tRNA pseudouridine38-40 synthase